jgi:hypothetical protein
VELTLDHFANDFAAAIARVDQQRPQAVNARSGVAFQPGIGPHTEEQTIRLVLGALVQSTPERYRDHALAVPYPSQPRQKCDLCLGIGPAWTWAVEIKMLRLMGDDGKPNDNMIMHILSPYPAHGSALTDSEKLIQSGFAGKKMLAIYGYDYPAWPQDPVIDAFETLAQTRVRLGERYVAVFDELIHPVHRQGRVFAWEVTSQAFMQHRCAVCGQPFTGRRDAKFCSPACRQLAYRQRGRGSAAEHEA